MEREYGLRKRLDILDYLSHLYYLGFLLDLSLISQYDPRKTPIRTVSSRLKACVSRTQSPQALQEMVQPLKDESIPSTDYQYLTHDRPHITSSNLYINMSKEWQEELSEENELAAQDKRPYMVRLLAGEEMTIEEQIKGFAETQAKVMGLIYGKN